MAAPVTRGSNREFFLARVAAAQEEFAAATLDNVRERCRRSEAAWQQLADRADHSARLRAAEEQRRSDRDGLAAAEDADS